MTFHKNMNFSPKSIIMLKNGKRHEDIGHVFSVYTNTEYYDVLACICMLKEYLYHYSFILRLIVNLKELESQVLSVQEGESWSGVPNAVVVHC